MNTNYMQNLPGKYLVHQRCVTCIRIISTTNMKRDTVYFIMAAICAVAAVFSFAKGTFIGGWLAVAGFLAMLLSGINYRKKNKII